MGEWKVLACAVALVAVLGVAGCGGQTSANAASGSADNAGTTAQSVLSIQSASESTTAAAAASGETVASAGSGVASSGVFTEAAELVAEAASLANAAGSDSGANANAAGADANAVASADAAAGAASVDAGAATADADASADADSASSQSSASSSADSATSNPATPPQDLIIDELGSTTSSKGYVYYGIRVTNPNDGYSAELPRLQATGQDEDGNILFTDTHTLRDVYPGESIYYGFRVGNGTVPSVVDLELSVGSGNWKQSNAKRDDLYSFDNLVDSGTQNGVNHFTGEITLNSDAADAKKPAVTVIVRDEDGNVIYGVTAFLQSNLVVGVPASFDIEARDLPENASTFDVHAMPWSA